VKRIIKRVVLGLLALIVVVVAGGGIYACVQVQSYEASVAKVYDVKPLDDLKRSTDAAVLARGDHLAHSVAPCAAGDCHGPDLGGGKAIDAGPIGVIAAPNISAGGLGASYSDGELARLVRHGIKKDGRTVIFMPSHEIGWLPDADLVAVVSYLRTLPPVDRPNAGMKIGTLGKILDVKGMIPIDVARRIDHQKPDLGGPPEPTAAYGRFLARGCTGCHGERFSGGRIPGAPSSFPVPLNLTPHETGLGGWSFDDFDKLLSTGIRKSGKKLDPFMPIETLGHLDPIERKALFAYLQTLPPLPLGNR
jgi:hypothetical protein